VVAFPAAIVVPALATPLTVTVARVSVTIARIAAALGVVPTVTGISRYDGDGGTADQQERGNRPRTGEGA
jgi:hypothetical protein